MNPLPIPPNSRLERAELLGTILIVHWRDGHRSELPLEALRRSCPCAACLGERKPARSPLRVLAPVKSELTSVEPVGRYALQFFWKDGHATGIYSYDLLRQLCECPDCAGS